MVLGRKKPEEFCGGMSVLNFRTRNFPIIRFIINKLPVYNHDSDIADIDFQRCKNQIMPYTRLNC